MKFLSILYLPPSVLFVKTNENHRILHEGVFSAFQRECLTCASSPVEF